jgi:hypothetical protein
VIDPTEHVYDPVVRARIAERREPFPVGAAQLVRMADAGVAPAVIDVVVAVSYPRDFTVADDVDAPEAERREAAAPPAPSLAGVRRTRFWDPFYGFGYYSYYDRLEYGGYSYGYGGFGYPGRFRPSVIVVQPRQETQGRVVNGRGYTRNRPSTPSSPAPAPSSSSGSSGSGDSSAGSGSGSSGGSTGRTAQPRPPEG